LSREIAHVLSIGGKTESLKPLSSPHDHRGIKKENWKRLTYEEGEKLAFGWRSALSAAMWSQDDSGL
jgi:hypothetical protein